MLEWIKNNIYKQLNMVKMVSKSLPWPQITDSATCGSLYTEVYYESLELPPPLKYLCIY